MLTGLFIPSLERGSVPYVMAIIGGVGGSVTLLSYGYWIAEKSWKGRKNIQRIKIDLAVDYVLTSVFGVAIVIIAANLKPEVVKSNQIILALSEEMNKAAGPMGKWIFLIGFWGAVFSSMLGVWQGIPYLFADFVQTWRKEQKEMTLLHSTKYYRFFLFFLAISPVVLLYFQKPVWLILVYSVIGALFMPFIAVTLLWINNKKEWIKTDRNSLLINVLLGLSLCLFLYLATMELIHLL